MRSWIEVSRGRLAANFAAVKAVTGPGVEVCPVVKADAYRHGAAEVTRVLSAAGARWFAVSSVEEGVALRQAGLSSPRHRILVMADRPGPELTHFDLTPAIHDLADLAVLSAPMPFHLKIDSGMGRLGTRAEPAEIAGAVAAAEARGLRFEGLMTHFASSADYASGQTEAQLARFEAVLAALPPPAAPRYIHTSATVAVAYARRAAWKTMVRPGHAIYGYVSPIVRGHEAAPARLLEVRPALEWKARLLAIKDVPAGEPIGYGAMFRAPAAMRIGIVAAGYADGIPHRLGNKGSVITAGGRVVPMLGAVSMDVSTIDLTAVPEARAGDAVTLLGEQGEARIDAQMIARLAGTISYSVLCGISSRVAHVYVD